MSSDPHPHYNAADEQPRLLEILAAMYLLMLRAVSVLVGAHFDLEPERFRVDDATTRRFLAKAATRVVRIDQTTRAAIASMLETGHARGYNNWQIANGVPDDGFLGISGLFTETWKGRAEMVARTELQEAQRAAAVERYVATGLVDRVQIIDGCQWDEPCCERNGKTVPIQQAPALNHPNCTLVLVPILRQGISQPSPQQGEAAAQPALL